MPVYFHQSKNLPSEYQEVEYIESSGTQYIVIGTSFKTSYKTVTDFQINVIGGDYIPVGIKYGATRYGIDAYNSNFMVNGGGEIWVNTISEDTNRHTITIDKGTAIVDGNNYSVSYTDYTFSQGIGVFCYNEYDKSSQYTYKSSNKLYKLDIYDENGTHIYDLVPCYRKSDNVIGLYDLVNDVFYTNSGTGTFSKGSNVSNDYTIENLSRCYLGDKLLVGGNCGWEPNSNTLLYCPFMGDYINKVTNESYVSASSASLDSSGNYVNISNGWLKYNLKRDLDCSKGFTFNGFIKYASINTWNRRALSFNRKNFQSGDGQSLDIRITGTQRKNRDGVPLYTLIHYTEEVSEWRGTNRTQTDLGTWYNVCLTYDGSSEYMIQWLNGTKKICPLATLCSSPDNKIFKGLIDYIRIGVDDNNYDRMDGSVGNYIIEEGVRSDNMIISWFNNNKSIYGIS